MTPAVRLAKKHKVTIDTLEYQHDANCSNFGEEAASATGKDPSQVFKTLLVAIDDNSPPIAVALVPVNSQLNLKALAKQLKIKKLQMASMAQAEKSTGYLVGGISPLAQKKALKTLIDTSAQAFTQIFVSGGKRGLQIAISPQDLTKLCRGEFAQIKQ